MKKLNNEKTATVLNFLKRDEISKLHEHLNEIETKVNTNNLDSIIQSLKTFQDVIPGIIEVLSIESIEVLIGEKEPVKSIYDGIVVFDVEEDVATEDSDSNGYSEEELNEMAEEQLYDVKDLFPSEEPTQPIHIDAPVTRSKQISPTQLRFIMGQYNKTFVVSTWREVFSIIHDELYNNLTKVRLHPELVTDVLEYLESSKADKSLTVFRRIKDKLIKSLVEIYVDTKQRARVKK